MSYALAEHDRMIAAMLMPCVVVGVDLAAAAVRVQSGDWVSAWVRWHSLAAGKARHWRAPSLNEQGVLFNPSGQAGMGTFIPGLYGDAGAQPDNRDHVEVWRFEDGGSLVYDWEAKSYSITLPTGTVNVKVGGTEAVVTDSAVNVTSENINLKGVVAIDGPLHVTQNITSDGAILDVGGNSNHHTH
ncbi:phage baseplate assembly protein V [Pseudomonas moorei]|uniref:Phage baseplate assembly protein V n=1 Tax=Pseudomonas moorei TaxID=395599 RepID=A0A1H1EGF0_9PSED|nr:phage baseplate assembly protein V [Pseudomonas moorei]KAB0507778.1 phage baseplate assembly protein V [Pseudomonas moorei]SDQ87875.1 phage baseplate assembly protein V [Pseudomonas moorei]